MDIKSEKEQQFVTIIESNRQLLYKVCYMYATDDGHFKDLYQEVLIHIWQGLKDFRGTAQLSTWIYRTALNTCVTDYRKNRKYGEMESIDGLSIVDVDDGTHRQQLKELYRLINRLDRFEKAIILLWLDEKSYDEISEITGLSRNNVASRLRRIKIKLQQYSEE
ncbi:MAG: sigma-70 family RNA polymerase sigma factor [Paludibacteraceae bacterium]|nr:sigma-70 family RNA polymerase sigma factor [Paludibacteraceae bacterium]